MYTEFPIMSSHHAIYNNVEDLPFGMNINIAICNFSGYNQEDSLVINRAASDRGLLRCESFKIISIEEKKHETFCHVKDNLRNPSLNYSKLDPNGFIVQVGSVVGIGDVLVSKIQRSDGGGSNSYKDCSVICRLSEEGIIDQVFISETQEGFKLVKIKIRALKVCEMGDKMASRNAQKGVCGMVMDEKDMPFGEKTGFVPDILFNSLSIPSRMTINQLLECYIAKECLRNDKDKFTVSIFSEASKNIFENIQDPSSEIFFENLDTESYGAEVLINGQTGERIQGKVNTGLVYYSRLKHIVSNKVHARGQRGLRQSLTRQPTEGRSRSGGLRLGEMERDCFISHGLSAVLRERLFLSSDEFQIHCCNTCGSILTSINKNVKCDNCSIKNIEYSKIKLPYACKVLFQYLNAVGISTRTLPQLKQT